ncbi:conjugal transfer pilus assembly protein TraU [Janthinobacterium sp. J1-1]|uniref:conjugal transfer pilus assembly protein TraU n=1 Tax=Janthinobacterium sp. J1-1 TaxID=3065910 RepID=UPI00281100B6|nr:conjugal transfer pilus assembly protein TraU [Janthinobacterium sp. J1-1]
MKSLFKLLALLMVVLCACHPALAASNVTCTGKFMNPITDICWSCIFPISIGSTTILQMGQEDIENVGTPVCSCGPPPLGKVGISIGFWEPVRQVDVTRTPWCFTSLGGVTIGADIAPSPSVGQGNRARRSSNTSLYQAHWYVNPVLYWLEVLSETSCLEHGGLDIAYVSELDPSWNDDDLAVILSPDVFLFANPAAQAACAADCVAATAGFPLSPMHWCGGCQGSMFPLNGHVQSHVGGVQASSLIMQRYAMKLHREFLAFAGNGTAGWCGLYPAPVLDKRIYKYSMLYPSAQGKGPDGRCCQPMGRTTHVWSAGKEYPIKGEDFAYMMYRKRNCCERIYGWIK